MALGYSKSCLIGALLECIVYGLYFTIFSQTLIILRRKLIPGAVSIYLTTTTFILFVLITMRLVLDNKAAVEAFADDPLTANAAEIYYTNFGNGAMFRTGTYIALTIIADIFIVYRVFAIWSRSVVATIGPFLLAIADIVTGALFIKEIRQLEKGASPNIDKIAMHALLFYGFTLGLNVVCTLLIALRLFITQQQAAKAKMAPSMNLKNTMVIVIESSALYSAFLIAMLVCTTIGSNVQYCILSMMPGIVGLSFSLIIVRIGSGVSPDSTATGPGSHLQFRGAGRSEFATTEQSHIESATLGHQHSGDKLGVSIQLKTTGARSLASLNTKTTHSVESDKLGGKQSAEA